MAGRRRSSRGVDLRIAPLIDLAFILLIFFLVGARFTRETTLPIERPTATTGTPLSRTPVTVTVTATGTVRVDGEDVSLAFLPARLRGRLLRDPDRPVLIAADRRLPTGRLVAVMDACRLGGANEVLLGAREAEP